MQITRNFTFVVGVAALHLTLLYSVFDVYFTSPVVTDHDAIDPVNDVTNFGLASNEGENDASRGKLNEPGRKHHKHEALAKRLVIFVADGFRADSLYENDMINTKFLREVVLQTGASGTAQTRVPTESRPGHVAMLAGVYEDVSAITTGWRSNPVDVDSLLNRSSAAFAFGSADIVLPFVDSASGSSNSNRNKETEDFPAPASSRRHVAAFTYGGDLQNYAKSETWKLDAFAFDKFEQLLANFTAYQSKKDRSSGGARLENSANQELDSDAEWNAERAGRDGAVFLVHLLGLDVAGHSFKPGSRELLRNARYVDERVRRSVHLVNRAFGDCDTLFVLTADHGMTDWGSHGASTPHETVVPLVLFGATTRFNSCRQQSTPAEFQQPFDDAAFFSQLDAADSARAEAKQEKSVGDLPKYSIEQADLCTLLAALLGLAIPSNSVGVLPGISTARLALAAETIDSASFSRYYLVQARHCVALLDAKRSVARRQRSALSLSPFAFRDFSELRATDAASRLRLLANLSRNQLDASSREALADESRTLCQTALRGFLYFHNHDAPVLGSIIALIFAGSMVCAVMRTTDIADDSQQTQRKSARRIDFDSGLLVFLAANLIVAALCYVQSIKLSHSMYCMICVWTLGAAAWSVRDNLQKLKLAILVGGVRLSLLNVVVALLTVEVGLVAFEHRVALVAAQLLFCLSPSLDQVQHAAGSSTEQRQLPQSRGHTQESTVSHRVRQSARPASPTTPVTVDRRGGLGLKLRKSWLLTNAFLAVFCVLPTIGKWTNCWLVFSSGLLFLGTYASVLLPLRSPKEPIRGAERIAVLMFTVAMVMATAVGYCVEKRIEIPAVCHLVTWSVAAACLVLPFLVPPAPVAARSAASARFRLLVLTLATLYFLMSLAYEGFFLVALLLVIVKWSQGESVSATKAEETRLSTPAATSWSEQLRLVATFVHLVLFSFFGTGNLASINSFNVQAVYTFVTVFSPFTMTALMLFKIIVPFVLVSLAVVPMARASGVPLRRFLLFTLMLSDLMALQLFFAIRNQGSWFEIGSSISRYVIVMSIAIFAFLLFAIAHLLLGGDRFASLRTFVASSSRFANRDD